jgi:hypothetical protein
MKGLLLRLSTIDADAESAVRVIACFDELIARRAGRADVVRLAASLAECPAGLQLGQESPTRFHRDGTLPGDRGAVSAAVAFGPPGSGRVWLERPGVPGPLDELILERFAIAARSLAQPGRPRLTDPSLVELVLGDQATAEDRTRALVLLGLDVTRPVRVVAIDVEGRGAPETVALDVLTLAGLVAGSRTAVVGGVTAAILQPRQGINAVVCGLRDILPLADTAVRVGVGDAVDALDARWSWQQAMVARRFADAIIEPLVVHETLGTLALLAEIGDDRLRADRDVRALCELAHTRSGAEDIAVLEAFCRTGSLRQAARVLHRHHSSVASRLSHVEDAMGWQLDDPADRFRARLTLLARRLVDQLPV